MRLALVVPALNEEEAIAGTLRRALAARAKVCAETPVEEMFVVFVNDGSTDRTQEIVDQAEFAEVVKVRFPRNRGYGAAIKAGWKATGAELVGFIDGDGTCDPDFCVPLLQRLLSSRADVVLAGRMSPASKMPPVRRLGNAFFARLLSLLSGRTLSDSASGFRIVRRSSLPLISPLPDRLHFTPAMSCVCLFDRRLSIVEVPMPYEERIGRSKLSVVRDGLRFLFTILFAAFFYAPVKMMGIAALCIAAAYALLLAILSAASAPPILLREVAGLGCAAVLMTLASALAQRPRSLARLTPPSAERGAEGPRRAVKGERMMGAGFLTALGSLLALLVFGLLPGGWAGDHQPVLHILVALVLLGSVATIGGLLLRAVWMGEEKLLALREDEFLAASFREETPRP